MNWKMKYSTIPVVMVMILSMLVGQACSSQNFLNVVKQINAQLPVAIAAVNTVLAITDPALIPLVNGIGEIAQVDLKTLADVIVEYQANPNLTARQKIEVIVDKLVNEVDSRILALNQVGSHNALLVIVMLGVLSTALHLMDGFIISAQNGTQKTQHASNHPIKMEQIMPFLDKAQMELAAQQHGVTLEQSVSYARAYGF